MTIVGALYRLLANEDFMQSSMRTADPFLEMEEIRVEVDVAPLIQSPYVCGGVRIFHKENHPFSMWDSGSVHATAYLIETIVSIYQSYQCSNVFIYGCETAGTFAFHLSPRPEKALFLQKIGELVLPRLFLQAEQLEEQSSFWQEQLEEEPEMEQFEEGAELEFSEDRVSAESLSWDLVSSIEPHYTSSSSSSFSPLTDPPLLPKKTTGLLKQFTIFSLSNDAESNDEENHSCKEMEDDQEIENSFVYRFDDSESSEPIHKNQEVVRKKIGGRWYHLLLDRTLNEEVKGTRFSLVPEGQTTFEKGSSFGEEVRADALNMLQKIGNSLYRFNQKQPMFLEVIGHDVEPTEAHRIHYFVPSLLLPTNFSTERKISYLKQHFFPEAAMGPMYLDA